VVDAREGAMTKDQEGSLGGGIVREVREFGDHGEEGGRLGEGVGEEASDE